MKTMTKTMVKSEPTPVKRFSAKAAKKQPEKKMSQIEAAVAVLRKAGEPMNCKAMVETMEKKKLWSSPGGKTPEATLYAAILREITVKGKEARFVKASPGHFKLAKSA